MISIEKPLFYVVELIQRREVFNFNRIDKPIV